MKLTEEEKRLFGKVLKEWNGMFARYNGANENKFEFFDRDLPEGADKWTEPLIDHAHEDTQADEGDFVSSNNGETWFEIVDIEVEPYEEMSGKTIYIVNYRLWPTDQYGNAYSKEQVEEMYKDDEYWKYIKQRLDSGKAPKGFHCEITSYDDPVHFSKPLLVVSTDASKSAGGKLRHINTKDRPYTFIEYDDWGRPVLKDEYLKSHPDYDPDVDEVDNEDYYKTYSLPTSGNQEVRDTYNKAKKDWMDKRREIRNKYKDGLASASRDGMFKDWPALMPDVSEEDMKKMIEVAKIYLYSPKANKERTGFDSLNDFRKWMKDVGGDPELLTKMFMLQRVFNDDSKKYSRGNWWNNRTIAHWWRDRHYDPDEGDLDYEYRHFRP